MPDPTEQGLNPTHERYAWRGRFLSRINRFKNLLAAKWWIPLITVVIGLTVEGTLWRLEKPQFVSFGRMIMGIKIAVTEASVYSEELSNFLGTQQALMTSATVQTRARERVAATKPDLADEHATIKVQISPKTTIFILQATGEDRDYTKAFLDALMQEFVNYKNEMRAKTSGQTLRDLMEEVIRVEKDLNAREAELAAFRSTNSVVLSQEQGNSAANYLAALNQRLASLKSEHELLQLLTLDQNLERRQQAGDSLTLPSAGDGTDKTGSGNATDRTDTEYFKAKQQVLLLKAEQKELAQDLRPKHPKMIALTEDIARRERLLEIFRQQSSDQLESKKSSLALQIQNLERDIKEWDARTLEINRKMAEDQRLKGNVTRLQALYERLSATKSTVETSAPINSESVTISEFASDAQLTKTPLSRKLLLGALGGIVAGFLILFVLDRLDDRMNSFSELQDLFDEPVLGQIPKEKSGSESGAGLLVVSEATRHAFVEAYRNLRSSLLYIAESGARPRTIVVTSSVPGEGKSVTSANLAITLANAGSRVLLIDGDLRKGVLHELFTVAPEPGFSEVLSHGLVGTEIIQSTRVPNLWLLPRGQVSQKSSELFINPATGRFLKEIASQYDYVLVDTAPVMAADDVTSLAPNMDGTIFVVRADYTSARLARAALDLLYQRQVKVVGLVFNAVRPTTLDYYYYKYSDYYTAYPSSSKAVKA
jgi:capsular exopolysaccharide synthesis family protein